MRIKPEQRESLVAELTAVFQSYVVLDDGDEEIEVMDDFYQLIDDLNEARR